MPVNSPCTQYTNFSSIWKKCRDVAAGEDAVKAAGEAYLKKNGGQSDESYQSYKDRASFYNATGRTIEGLSGMVFRKKALVEVPNSINDYSNDIDLDGSSIHEFSQSLIDNMLTVRRAAILVEYTENNTETVITKATKSAFNLRPFLTEYTAENVINWRTARVNNAVQLVLVVLREYVDVSDDEFVEQLAEQYRVLKLEDGQYLQRVYQKDESGDYVQVGDDIVPLMNNIPLNFIPFRFVGGNSVQKPALIDLVNVNLSHYKNSADYEQSLHFTSMPNAVVIGADEQELEGGLHMGSSEAWTFRSPETKVFYLELQGNGVSPGREVLDAKKKEMATLGARMLMEDKKAAEAAETESIRRSGENAALTTIVNQVSEAMTWALSVMAEWEGVADKNISFELNKDFFATPMSPNALKELVSAFQGGAISYDDLHKNLQRGEIISADKSAEDSKEEIAEETSLNMDFDA